MEDSADCHDELMCPICFGEYQDPVMIQCHHSFCRKCITTWIEHNSQSEQGTFNCPCCKMENARNVELMKSFYVEQIRDIIKKNDEKSVSKFTKCYDHSEDLKFYCQDCLQPVCRDCKILSRHMNHDIEDIDIIANYMKDEIVRNRHVTCESIASLESNKRTVQNFISNIQKLKQMSIDDCYKRVDELQTDIQVLADVMVKEIEDNAQKLLRNQKAALSQIANEIECHEVYAEALEQLCISNNVHDFVSSFQQIRGVSMPCLNNKSAVPAFNNIGNRNMFESGETNLTQLRQMLGTVPDSMGNAGNDSSINPKDHSGIFKGFSDEMAPRPAIRITQERDVIGLPYEVERFDPRHTQSSQIITCKDLLPINETRRPHATKSDERRSRPTKIENRSVESEWIYHNPQPNIQKSIASPSRKLRKKRITPNPEVPNEVREASVRYENDITLFQQDRHLSHEMVRCENSSVCRPKTSMGYPRKESVSPKLKITLQNEGPAKIAVTKMSENPWVKKTVVPFLPPLQRVNTVDQMNYLKHLQPEVQTASNKSESVYPPQKKYDLGLSVASRCDCQFVCICSERTQAHRKRGGQDNPN